MANLVRDIPSVLYGTQDDYKRLFYSPVGIALTLPITIGPGYGVLKAGTLMSKNDSAAGNYGKYVPYDTHGTITGAENCPSRAYIVTDGAADNYAYVTMDDSYKFIVGDDLIAYDGNTSSPVAVGAITAIDRTTYAHMAKITGSANLTSGITTAQFGYVECEGADTADGVLMNTVDTGKGSTAQGAVANLIIGNAILYRAAIVNYDSNAASDLTLTVSGPYLIFK